MTTQTDINGAPGSSFGRYLPHAPVNTFTKGTDLAADNSQDWEYDELTGQIRAVVPAAMIIKLKLSSNDAVPQ